MHRAGADRGDTLVEILVALTVLSVGILGLVTALASMPVLTSSNRDVAKAETALLSASEYVKALTLPSSYFACTGSAAAPVPNVVPRDPKHTLTYGPPAQIDTTPCADLVRIPVTVTEPGSGFTRTLDVVRRRP